MKLEFLNHSSIVVRENDVALMCDFWQDGTAFDDGWALLCEPSFDYPDFEHITHLWISHEHPDHFSPKNLKQIPEEFRANITLLFQHTEDKRVISFCERLNFRSILEMEHGKPYSIGDGIEVICAPYAASWGDVDSWLYVKTPSGTLLNINDCEVETEAGAKRIKEMCGPIDVLATQFSYASKQADSGDDDWIERIQKYYFNLLDFKTRQFGAPYVLPFASFVYWCHRENRYLNKGIIHVHDAADRISANGFEPVVMYPGDEWTVGEAHDNQPSLQRYAQDYDAVEHREPDDFISASCVDEGTLIESADKFLSKMTSAASKGRLSRYIAGQHAAITFRHMTNPWRRRASILSRSLRGSAEPVLIYVYDLEKVYEFSINNGLRPVDTAISDCHVRIGSQALLFGFSVGFGGESLQVNGRFDNVKEDGWRYLSAYFYVARKLEQGWTIPAPSLLRAAAAKLGVGKSPVFEG